MVLALLLSLCLSVVFPRLSSLFTPREYLVVLQNNYELRPTGGFLGSYARVRIAFPHVEILKVEDIYVPDGQLEGHVEPPEPILVAFRQGWFRLRDSNWDPNFPTSAQTMLWFFAKGKEPPADGLIAVNMMAFATFLEVVGSLPVLDAPPLTVHTFYEQMQAAVELGFFPGSIQKPMYLGNVARAARLRVAHLQPREVIQLGLGLVSQLRDGHIMVYSTRTWEQRLITWLGIDGSLPRVRDIFGIVEANLGTNKANCCISRSVSLQLAPEDTSTTVRATVLVSNSNPTTIKNPPYSWGGAYVVYIQALVPLDATQIAVRAQGIDKQEHLLIDDPEPLRVDREHWWEAVATHSAMHKLWVSPHPRGVRQVGTLMIVDAQQQEEVVFSYRVPRRVSRLTLYKQPGIRQIPYTVQTDTLRTIPITRTTQLSL